MVYGDYGGNRLKELKGSGQDIRDCDDFHMSPFTYYRSISPNNRSRRNGVKPDFLKAFLK